MKVMLCGFARLGIDNIIKVQRMLLSMNLEKHYEAVHVIQVQGLTMSTAGNDPPFVIVHASCREDYDMAVNAIKMALPNNRPSRSIEVSWVKLEANEYI